MKLKFRLSLPIFVFLSALLILPFAQAASVSVSQSGADSGTVMKGRTFTITVSGLSGSGTVNLVDTPTGFSSEEGTSKSFSSGTTSVTWTTAAISQTQTGVKIKVTIQYAQDNPGSAESSSFDVVLPPSISLSVTPTSVTVNRDSTYTVSLNVQNSGGTTASSVSFSLSGTGMSVSSGCSTISSISAGSSSSVSCSVLASTAGSQTVSFTATPSNADPKTESISVTVSAPSEDGDGDGDGDGGGVGPGVTKLSETVRIGDVAEGETGEAVFTEELLMIQAIYLTPNANLTGVSFSVTKEDKKPGDVTKPDETVFHYFTITALNVREGNITSAKIKFKVNQSWFSDNNIDKNSVTLLRWKDNKWQVLKTTMLNEDSNYVYYEAETPGFSYFAIVGKVIEVAVCTTGDKRCSGNYLQECKDNQWLTIETCQFGCDPGKLRCMTEEEAKCTEGEKRCTENYLQECKDGQWQTIQTCEFGCENKQCKEKPTEILLPAIADYWWVVVLVIVIVAILIFTFFRRRKSSHTYGFEK